MNDLRAAAERYMGDEDSLHGFVFDGQNIQNADGYIVAKAYDGMEEDCRAILKLAAFAARILSTMPDGEGLPEGPWSVHDGDYIRDGRGDLVAIINPWDEIKRAQEPAVAALLIWARGVIQ